MAGEEYLDSLRKKFVSDFLKEIPDLSSSDQRYTVLARAIAQKAIQPSEFAPKLALSPEEVVLSRAHKLALSPKELVLSRELHKGYFKKLSNIRFNIKEAIELAVVAGIGLYSASQLPALSLISVTVAAFLRWNRLTTVELSPLATQVVYCMHTANSYKRPMSVEEIHKRVKRLKREITGGHATIEDIEKTMEELRGLRIVTNSHAGWRLIESVIVR